MNRTRVLLVTAAALAACGADSGDSPPQQGGAMNACELLPADVASQLLGEAVTGTKETMNMNQGAYAYSQCMYSTAASGNRFSVQVTRSGKPIEQSRQQDADELRSEDDGTGMSIEYAVAVENGRDIDGLGGVAYTFETDSSTHLVAYPDRHYKIQVTMSHTALGKEKTVQVSQAVAQSIMDSLED